jgi:CubicO group peptidase (beta-lactamase class C family)
LRSTVTDLVSFARACIDPPDGPVGEALQLARQPAYRSRFPSGSKGLGWMLRAHPQRPSPTTWHNGGTYGASSFLAVDPDLSRAVVALGNTGPGLLGSLDSPSWAVFDGAGTKVDE